MAHSFDILSETWLDQTELIAIKGIWYPEARMASYVTKYLALSCFPITTACNLPTL